MKNHHHNNPIHPLIPSHEDIALSAYLRWLDQGQPENLHEAIWLEAEDQLIKGKSQ
jgi:hypothetical protein